MDIRAKLTGKFNDPAAQEILTAALKPGVDGAINVISYNFKHFPAPEGGAFDYNPRLVRQETVLKPKEMLLGEGEIILRHSDYDPWVEVEIVRILGPFICKAIIPCFAARPLRKSGLWNLHRMPF